MLHLSAGFFKNLYLEILTRKITIIKTVRGTPVHSLLDLRHGSCGLRHRPAFSPGHVRVCFPGTGVVCDVTTAHLAGSHTSALSSDVTSPGRLRPATRGRPSVAAPPPRARQRGRNGFGGYLPSASFHLDWLQPLSFIICISFFSTSHKGIFFFLTSYCA